MKTTTVGELIAELQRFPADRPVLVSVGRGSTTAHAIAGAADTRPVNATKSPRAFRFGLGFSGEWDAGKPLPVILG